ncbi:hypothetical protein AWN76_002970 [Rhodothermaceae bacterium RA]|nr:hypothetical protein AWN76_002970 [Rhodothermaceae bacterium RA]
MPRSLLSRRDFTRTLAAAGLGLPLAARAPQSPDRPHPARPPLCIFSKHLQWLRYDEMAEVAAEIGFDGVDLTVRSGGHVRPGRVEDDLPRAVEAVRRAGLAVPLMTTAITDPDAPDTVAILHTAQQLGITHYRLGYLRYDDDLGVAGTLDALRPRLRDLAALNAEYGLHGAYQNHSGTGVGGPVWDLWLLLDGLDPRWIGCQYDVRHATVEGGTAWPLGLKLLHRYIRTMVIKDFTWEIRGRRARIRNVPLGEGIVDFKHYFSLIRELGVSGPISLHLEYDLPEPADPTKRRRQTIAVLRRDLTTLRTYLDEAGL